MVKWLMRPEGAAIHRAFQAHLKTPPAALADHYLD